MLGSRMNQMQRLQSAEKNIVKRNITLYQVLLPHWIYFCLQNCNNSLRYRFNKVLKMFLKGFGTY